MAQPLRFGVLGCARIVRRGFIGGVERSGTAQITAIASRRMEVARRWAEELNIPHVYGDYGALIQSPEVDAVYIPLPNDLHSEWTLKAAAAGKHVLCEKPLARSVPEAEEMVNECRARGVVLMDAFMWRHHPRATRAKEMVAQGQIGELRLVKMDFSFDIDRSDWRLDPARGGGALFDLGCYGINAARFFVGTEPVEFFGRGTFHEAGVDMTVGFEMRFASGAMALADCSFECPYRNRLEIVGTRGSVELPGGVLPEADGELIDRTSSWMETVRFPGDQYAEEVKIFCASVHAGRLVWPAEDGLANMRALVAVQQQVRASGRPL